ncbi:MAG: sigma-54-dependent Fis family transcriptional regulator [Acidobacteria bacterium]|nr:sigma-54-dependent Fis family transcriptional regulator [Acidobacteriota bacterium]
MSVSPNSEVRLLGTSEVVRNILADIDCAARSGAKVLITGETGVGKEVVARLIHHRSARAAGKLVTVNCAGLPDSLLESELFGHVRGSFTGAYRDKPGLLEMAPNGTVFLDEVGEMSARMQVVLLRFLETGEIQRIGADRSHTRVNVRLITATNRDLPKEIAAGNFREDLFFRLNVIRMTIPPLRERIEDVPLLFDHYLALYCEQHRVERPEISQAALDVLLGYRWPGNIRELRNVAERIALKSVGQILRPADLPSELLKPAQGAPLVAGAAAPTHSAQVEEMTQRMLRHGESFWSVVYPVFMARDLTRADLRRIVEIGLESTNGNYRLLVALYNMPNEDYKRFLGFLRKHNCHLPFQRFRTIPSRVSSGNVPRTPVAAAG